MFILLNKSILIGNNDLALKQLFLLLIDLTELFSSLSSPNLLPLEISPPPPPQDLITSS